MSLTPLEKELLEALKIAFKPYEEKAVDLSIACEFGVSEWESMLTDNGRIIYGAIKHAEEKERE